MERSGTLAWAGLATGIIIYDAVAKETLSEAYDRFIDRHKVLAIGTVAVTALHLTNCLPPPVDPLYQISKHTRSFAEKYL